MSARAVATIKHRMRRRTRFWRLFRRFRAVPGGVPATGLSLRSTFTILSRLPIN